MKVKAWYIAAASILFLVCGISLIVEGNAGAGITGIVIAVLVAILFMKVNGYIFQKKAKKSMPVTVQERTSAHEKYLPEIQNFTIKYEYQNVGIASRDRYPINDLEVSDRLHFVHESENAYDPAAVAVYRGKDKIGYLFKGRLQVMCVDFLRGKEPVYGVLTNADRGAEVMTLAFYRYGDSESE